jgi:hypothetical protein
MLRNIQTFYYWQILMDVGWNPFLLVESFKNESVGQSNLCTTTTLGIPNLWPLLTGGRCSVVGLCYEDSNWDSELVFVAGMWSLA